MIDPSATGAYWNGTEMVLGEGYDNAAVLIHETNHAQATVNGESADANNQSRNDYVTTAVNEEVNGTVEQIQAAQELRIAGYTVAPTAGRGGVHHGLQPGHPERSDAGPGGTRRLGCRPGRVLQWQHRHLDHRRSLPRLLRRLLGQRALMRETWNLTGTRVRRTSMTGHHRRGVRALLAGAALLVAATLSACGPGGPEPGATPSTTTGPSVTSSPGDVRGRLASALQGTSPAYAKLVENPQTSLTPVDGGLARRAGRSSTW